MMLLACTKMSARRHHQVDESKPAMLVPSAAVALNSLAETTLQKIPPDPASAQCISKRRPSRNSSSAGRAWSAQSPEVVGGWMILSQVELPRSLSFATREKCSVRQVNMTISLAFLAPNLVKAAVEGRLPRGIGVERLRDPPTEWSRQFEALGLNPE